VDSEAARPRADLLRRHIDLIAALLLAIGVAILLHALYQNRLRYRTASFYDYYPWSLELRLGGDPWIPADNPAYRPHPGIPHHKYCNYPPAFVAAFQPLTLLEPRPAYWIWQAILIASLALAALMLVAEMRPHGRAPYLIALAALLLFPETYGALYESEPTFLLLALVVAAWWLDKRELPAVSGPALAVATLLKMYPGLVGLYFLLRKRWAMLGWSIVLAVVGLVFTNLRYEYEFIHFGVPIFGRDYWLLQERQIAILANLRWIMSVIHPGAPSGAAAVAWLGATALACLALIAAAARATRQSAASMELDVMCLGIWIGAALMISPLAWAHELPLMFPIWLGAAAAIARGAEWRNAGVALLAVGLALIYAAYFASPLRRQHLFFIAALATYAGACLAVARWSREQTPRTRCAPEGGGIGLTSRS
jgi:Glycosyltransferase family 87